MVGRFWSVHIRNVLQVMFSGRLVATAENSSPTVCGFCSSDTVEANLALGLPEDMRDYRAAAEILLDLGVWRARLITNNPAKIEGLEWYGVEVVERITSSMSPNPSNVGYLRTKREKMGHFLPKPVALEGVGGGLGLRER
ncbi:MAG: ribA [Rubrobacteraceae bacterium]|nr:ribA [Rubrobacteraceae bacterium]